MKNSNINLNKIYFYLKDYFISLLFAFSIFFWSINFGIIQLRFSIIILFFFILINLNKTLIKKFSPYLIFSLIIFFHSYIVSENIFSDFKYNLFPIIIILFLLMICDFYKEFFFKNLNKIIFLYLTIFYIFLIFQFFSYENYFSNISNNYCIGCFSTLRQFYKENSHLGLLAPTIIYYLIYLSKAKKIIKYSYLTIFLYICISNISLTFIAGLFLMFFLLIFLKVQKITSLKFLLISILIFIPIVADKNLYRLKIFHFFYENDKHWIRTNLSTEVYQASIFIAKKSIMEKPFGYGLNNYHYAFDKYISEYEYHNWETPLINKKDASINFSKIVTEFGLFSIFIFLILIKFLFSNKIENNLKLFLLLPIISQLFIRGVGYFNSGFILFLFFVFIISLEKKYNKDQN